MWRSSIGACVIAAAAWGVSAGAGQEQTKPSPDACVVAEVGGVTLVRRDVDAMTAAITPAPSAEEANRLLVDATVAQWVVRGFVAGSSARARLASYRALSTQLATMTTKSEAHVRALSSVLARAKQELGVRTGDCYAAPTWTPPAVPAVSARELAALRATPQALERRAEAQGDKRRVVRATLWRLAPRLERIAPGPLFADELEPALGRAVANASPGGWVGPLVTDSGVYVARMDEESRSAPSGG